MSPKPPYYAAIFTSTKTGNRSGYAAMAKAMEELAKKQPGFLGMETAQEQMGITVSYWENLEAMAQWKSQADHQFAQQQGKNVWYSWYKVRICRVEREYEFTQP
ncbi:Antibiotic biosynthesis monooxygenase [Croceitalea dokdonensis DOKDO 023]|uniref:Antibiotic biosynthesis monooxygenase n=1 Tax=Croceitalea dokdonensis DOKDO 023 TaxID=1300341 RepID=A0A0P7B3E6_9FLAO|nr:antibiotic biosynthesis monooxygenase [Croceitalea dokdonensis]KPM33009.1 Antibiotic biosynthesis monooxygenase [Croceitalea dokdonensis DOKDO 023]